METFTACHFGSCFFGQAEHLIRILKQPMTGFGEHDSLGKPVEKPRVETFGDNESRDIPKVASGFGGGIGSSKEDVCGILTGGVIALGWLYGRSEPGADINNLKSLTGVFRKKFIERIGSTKCPEILEKLGEQEKMIKCKKLTAEMTGVLWEIIG